VIKSKSIYVINIDEEGRFGGPERRIINVAKELSNIGVRTTIVMPHLDSDIFEKYATENNVDYKKLNITRLTLEKKYLLKYVVRFFFELILLYKFLRKENPDVVHVNGAYQFKSILAAFLAKKKIVWHLNNQHAHKAVKFVFDFLKKHMSLSFIVASQKAKEYFIPNASCNTFVTEIHAPIIPGEILQKKNYNFSDEIVIGTITNMSPQKDIVTFIRAAHQIKLNYPNVVFCIGGAIHSSQKEHYNKIMLEIKRLDMVESIQFVGFVLDVPLFLSSLDIFINTSAWEGSPTAVWEALAAALPVVTTDVGSTGYYVGRLNGGLVSDVYDYMNISYNACKFIENISLREEYGVRAREIAHTYLTVEKCAVLHKQHYMNLIKEEEK
jgi:glycosyltransferase involved in cell wall biosynthesis